MFVRRRSVAAPVTTVIPAHDPSVQAWPTPFVFDESAMSDVVQSSWLPLIRLATLLLGDRVAAEDAVQEACEGVWRRRPSVASREHLANYLRMAVVNQARSAGRKRVTGRRHLRAQRVEDAPPADVALLADESNRELLSALDRLGSRQRAVLVLRYWSQLSEAEIAQTLGIAPGTVKSTAHQALLKLQRSLKGIR
jgi:RNA polymerase sigma-70 factor (sigma-E family)